MAIIRSFATYPRHMYTKAYSKYKLNNKYIHSHWINYYNININEIVSFYYKKYIFFWFIKSLILAFSISFPSKYRKIYIKISLILLLFIAF